MTDVTMSTPSRTGVAWTARTLGYRLVVEFAVVAALFGIYRVVRGFRRDDLAIAFENAADVIGVESMLGLLVEDDLQRWILSHDALVTMLNHYYICSIFRLRSALSCGSWCGGLIATDHFVISWLSLPERRSSCMLCTP